MYNLSLIVDRQWVNGWASLDARSPRWGSIKLEAKNEKCWLFPLCPPPPHPNNWQGLGEWWAKRGKEYRWYLERNNNSNLNPSYLLDTVLISTWRDDLIIILFFTTTWGSTVLSLSYKPGNGGKEKSKKLTFPKSHSQWVAEPGSGPMQPCSQAQDFNIFFEIITDLRKTCNNSMNKSIYTLSRLPKY